MNTTPANYLFLNLCVTASRMDPAGLDWMLPEVLFHLCLFLSEADITSLCQTCERLREVLNVEQVWGRFVTQEIKSLKTLKQQLDPPFHPDPEFCESRQHIQNRDHLISNWKHGNCVSESTKIERRYRRDYFYLFETQYYKEDYLLGKFDEDLYNRHHVFWNVHYTPKVWANKKYYDFFHCVGDKFAVRFCCGVEVYQINIEDKTFPLLHKFFIEGANVLDHYDFDANNCDPNDRCPAWIDSSGGNYLVFNKLSSDTTHPAIHIWDIVNLKKVGTFVSPVMCQSVKVFSFLDDTLILATQEEEETVYFKFDLTTKLFSDAVFKVTAKSDSVLFYKDYCIYMKDSSSKSSKSITLEVFEFNTSNKIAERCFDDTDYEFQRKVHRLGWGYANNVIVAVEGKLVILCSDSFHVIDALSLQTLSVVNEHNLLRVVGLISVFGTIFATTVGRDGGVKIWNVKEGKPVSNVSHKTLERNSLWRVEQFQRDFCLVPESGPKTKCVIVEEDRVTVTHFW